MNLYVAVADLGEGPGGPGPLFFLDQTEPQRAKKFFLGDCPPPPLISRYGMVRHRVDIGWDRF